MSYIVCLACSIRKNNSQMDNQHPKGNQVSKLKNRLFYIRRNDLLRREQIFYNLWDDNHNVTQQELSESKNFLHKICTIIMCAMVMIPGVTANAMKITNPRTYIFTEILCSCLMVTMRYILEVHVRGATIASS